MLGKVLVERSVERSVECLRVMLMTHLPQGTGLCLCLATSEQVPLVSSKVQDALLFLVKDGAL